MTTKTSPTWPSTSQFRGLSPPFSGTSVQISQGALSYFALFSIRLFVGWFTFHLAGRCSPLVGHSPFPPLGALSFGLGSASALLAQSSVSARPRLWWLGCLSRVLCLLLPPGAHCGWFLLRLISLPSGVLSPPPSGVYCLRAFYFNMTSL